MRGAWALRMRGVVVVGEVEDEEVEAVARDEPAPDRGGVRVDRPAGAVPHCQRSASRVRLEEAVEEEALRPVGRAGEHAYRRPVRRAAAVARDVDRSRRQPGVLERLVDRHRLPTEVAGVELVDRVLERAAGARGDDGAEGRAVLDHALLGAVVPDEVRDLVDVRMGARRQRGQTHGRQRRKRRRRTAVGPLAGEERQRRRAPVGDGALEHRRRQAVDHDQDQLPRRSRRLSPWRASGVPHSVRPACAAGAWPAPAARPSSRTRAPARRRGPRGRARRARR